MLISRFGVVLLMVVVLISGCTPSSWPSSPSPSSTLVPGPQSPTAPTATQSVVSVATPFPSKKPIDPLLNTVVVTVSDRVRMRSEPRVADDSVKYEPVLPLGTELTVLDGPVSGSGYLWYKVAPISFVGLDGPGYGWVALAGKNGEPWIAVGPADCPPVPTDVTTLARIPLLARLACFSGRPITVEARLIACNCDVDGGGYEPAWFSGGSQPLLLVEPLETNPPANYADWVIVRLDPASQYPGVLPVGQIAEVMGMFDHPAAQACLFQGVPVEDAGAPAPTSDCRFMFATTSLAVVRP